MHHTIQAVEYTHVYVTPRLAWFSASPAILRLILAVNYWLEANQGNPQGCSAPPARAVCLYPHHTKLVLTTFLKILPNRLKL